MERDFVNSVCAKNTIRSAWIGACFATVLFLLGCESDRGHYWMDDPRSKQLAGLPLPSDKDWIIVRERLITYNEVRVRFQSDVQIDFFVSNGFWFAAVVSRFEQDSGLNRAIVGWLRGSQLSFARKSHDDSLFGETLVRYNELRDRDSLWTLFESGEFWLDTVSFEALYKASGITSFPNGDWVRGPTLIKIRALKAKNHEQPGLPSNSGWMAYMAVIASHVFDSTLIDFSVGSVPTRSVDFAVHKEEWFFEFLSVTYDSNFVWTAIVGQHLGDSLIYRFVSEPLNPLEADKISEYKSAARAGDIFTLTGKTPIPDQVASYQKLWHDAATTSETRVWKIGTD